MNTTQLVSGLNNLELSGRTIHDRPIDGCHFELNPDGGGCIQIRLATVLAEELAASPICKVELEFRNVSQLDALIEAMNNNLDHIVELAETHISEKIVRLAELQK